MTHIKLCKNVQVQNKPYGNMDFTPNGKTFKKKYSGLDPET